MSLDTYENLKAEIIDWSHRDDIDLRVDTFIKIAESEMFGNTISPLKIRGQEVRSTASLSTSSRYLALPDGFQEMRKVRLVLAGESPELSMLAPEQMNINPASGKPLFFTVTSQLEFDRVPDSAYTIEMQHYQTPTGLSTANTTNVVLAKYPTIYLYGCLWALNEWADEEAKAQKYYQRFMNAIAGANKLAKSGRYGPAPSMRIEGSTP